MASLDWKCIFVDGFLGEITMMERRRVTKSLPVGMGRAATIRRKFKLFGTQPNQKFTLQSALMIDRDVIEVELPTP